MNLWIVRLSKKAISANVCSLWRDTTSKNNKYSEPRNRPIPDNLCVIETNAGNGNLIFVRARFTGRVSTSWLTLLFLLGAGTELAAELISEYYEF